MDTKHMTNRITLLAAAGLISATGFAQSVNRMNTDKDSLVTTGHSRSLIATAESFIIIPGERHEDLWVHPELVSVPGTGRVELRVRATDRRGTHLPSSLIYFSPITTFKTPLPYKFLTASFRQKVC